jgi:hypothetical protein
MLCDAWSDWTSGIARVNKSLALELSSHVGVTVYSTVMLHPYAGHNEDVWHSSPTCPVKLIRFGDATEDNCDVSEEIMVQDLYNKFNNVPAEMLRTTREPLPASISYIIGHAPVSAAAAVRLRDTTFPDSKVILFYHVIPDELAWTMDRLMFPLPDTEELIRLAETADVVYSVSPKVFTYFKAKFRNGARVHIDHRLMLPQSSRETFDTDLTPIRVLCPGPCHRLVAVCRGGNIEDWMGLDIAVCAAGKVAAALRSRAMSTEAPPASVTLTIINVSPMQIISVRDRLRREIATAERLGAKIHIKETAGNTISSDKQLAELEQRCYDLCLMPTRAEPYGYVGLEVLSAGLPTLLAEDCVLADLVKRLTCNPDYYLVKTTKDLKAVKKDATVWCQRIVHVLENPVVAKDQANLLRTTLRNDEATRETHDDFLTYCLGGIRVRFELTQLQFVSAPPLDAGSLDAAREAEVRRRFNHFLLSAMRQSWRVKRHPLETGQELRVILDRLPQLPIKELVCCVIDALEQNDRRIVSIDCQTGSLVISCPDVEALRDLWAMCDKVNSALRSILLRDDQDSAVNPVLTEFGLRKALTRVVMFGPEFLRYKQQLVQLRDG